MDDEYYPWAREALVRWKDAARDEGRREIENRIIEAFYDLWDRYPDASKDEQVDIFRDFKSRFQVELKWPRDLAEFVEAFDHFHQELMAEGGAALVNYGVTLNEAITLHLHGCQNRDRWTRVDKDLVSAVKHYRRLLHKYVILSHSMGQGPMS